MNTTPDKLDINAYINASNIVADPSIPSSNKHRASLTMLKLETRYPGIKRDADIDRKMEKAETLEECLSLIGWSF